MPTETRNSTIPRVDSKVDQSMRARQLVASLRQGRKIVVCVLDEGPFFGYLAGWDPDTYFLLEPKESSVNKLLIPKDHILWIQLVDQRTFREEALYDEMEPIIKPFRDAIDNQYPKR